MNISKYITYKEAVRSKTAERMGIKNIPNEDQLSAMKFVATLVFDKVREYIGNPLYVSSFFRSPTLNQAIGGSANSQHCKGEAIDIDCDTYGFGTNKIVFDYIRENLNYDQLIYEFGTSDNPAWVHVSLRRDGKNRKQVLRAISKGGRTVYVPYDI